MNKLTIFENENFALVMIGRELAFSLYNFKTKKVVFVQDNDATLFSEEIGVREDSGQTVIEILTEMWKEYEGVSKEMDLPYPWCLQPHICWKRSCCPRNPNCGE